MTNEKYKNSIKSVIPSVINKISGPISSYILTGKKEFKGVTIMLMGEIHFNNSYCNPCLIEDKCINAVELPQFISNKIKPNIIDLYVEVRYNPYLKTNNGFAINKENVEGKKRRLDLFGAKYFRRNKYIRGHMSDLRNNMLGYLYYNDNNKMKYIFETAVYYHNKKNNGEILKLRTDLLEYFFILDVLLQTIKPNKGNDFTFENFYREIFDKFKINKQQEKAIESHDNNKNITEIVNYFREYIKKILNVEKQMIPSKEITELIKTLNNITIKSNDVADRIIIKNIEIIKNIDFNLVIKLIYMLINLFTKAMDYYIFFRSLRKFDNKLQDNIIIYCGDLHITNLLKLYLKTKLFKLKNINDMTNNTYNSFNLINSCITVI